jgi:2'-5' RNA ligase
MPDAHERVRAFIAVDIPAEIKERIAGTAKELGSDGIRVVAADQMHITLFFLGYLDAAQVDSAKAIISDIDSKRFGISLNGMGTFAMKRPRVIFANIRDGAKNLHDIYETVSDRLPAMMKLEREEFTPHLTVARLKRFDSTTTGRARDFIDKYKDTDFGSFECAEVKLKQSVLTDEGAVHSDLYIKRLDS